MKCLALQVLGVGSSHSDVDVVAELRGRLEAAGLVATSSSLTAEQDETVLAAVAAEKAKYESAIAELKTNNESLKAKLKAVYKSNQDAKQRHAKDVAKLQKTVVEFQQQRAREHKAAEVERTGEGGGGGQANVSGEAGATSAENRSGVVLPPVNVASPQPRPTQPNPQATSAGDHDHHCVGQLSASEVPPLPPLALPRNSPTTTPRAAPQTTAIVLPNIAADNSAYQTNQQSSTSLRSQVCFISFIKFTSVKVENSVVALN